MLVVIAFLIAYTVIANRVPVHDRKTDELLNSLRKQLIENNYDYMSRGSEDEINMRAKSNEKTRLNNKRNKQTETYNVESKIFKDVKRENLYLAKVPEVAPKESVVPYEIDANKNDYTISKNDLLYYIDDHHFVSKSGSTTKKYKVLKLKHKSRRSGTNHLIQEEGNDGIAIVNLGGGPIPEFRLPRSRRQYMHDPGEVDDEEELPQDGDTVVTNPYIGDDIK